MQKRPLLEDRLARLCALPDAAKAQLANIEAVDAEILRLNQRLALLQTARAAYCAALQAYLAQNSAAHDALLGPLARAPGPAQGDIADIRSTQDI